MTLTVAIVGRPNVGKSTLFNRLVGRRSAIVDDTPGVTRDRREGEASLYGLTFRVIDTAGLEEADEDSMEGRMRAQTERAVAEADVVLMLVDARAGITPLDAHFAGWLRRHPKPVILVANKSEGRAGDSGYYEAFGLGLGEPVAVSAEHGEGMADLHEALLPHWAPEDEAAADEAEAEAAGPLRLAVVGRPNVGKSTLVNRLVGEERLLTGPEAGLTRDAIEIDWQHGGRPVRLVDTAGLRRRANVVAKLEKLSVAETLEAIRRSNVVVLVLDARAAMEKQDLTIARMTVREGRALVVALNKWDLVEDRRAALRQLHDRLERSLPQVRGIPTVTVSALTGAGLEGLMDRVVEVYDLWNRRVSTGQLNRWLEEAVGRHPPPAVQGRRVKLRYITQPKSRPPTFVIFTSRPEGLPDSYTRYLVNGLRDAFDLPGVPVRLLLRKGRNPYVGE